jgi:hypothetical protein
MTKKSAVDKTLAIQSWLRPALTPVGANKDYALFKAQLDAVDLLLGRSHLEAMALDFAAEGFEQASTREQLARRQFALKALRVETLRMLLGNPSFRQFSRTVAASDLLADFCGVRRLDGIRGISKSVLERASKLFRADQVRWMQQVLTEMCGETARASELGLARRCRPMYAWSTRRVWRRPFTFLSTGCCCATWRKPCSKRPS